MQDARISYPDRVSCIAHLDLASCCFTISGPRKRMLKAIAALSGSTGASAYPSVAMASVMLCATVKAVTVFSSIQRSFTISKSPSTKSKWSAPKRMWRMPSTM